MEVCIDLKQKTPMWHFQADVSGCVLRATEVKPKLDRFLLAKENKVDESWCVKGRSDALDYKLWFVAPSELPLTLHDKSYPLFFGNMGGGQPKQLIFYKGKIEMHLFSLNDKLIACIKKHLFEFFATHSFGTRQDKGFGFFFPVDIDGTKGNFNQAFGAHYQFDFEWKSYEDKRRNSNWRLPYPRGEHKYVETFMAIHYFHKLIRSGINERGCYYKSLMFFYARKRGLQWDKPTIRHHFQLYTQAYQSICGLLDPPYTEIIPRRSGRPVEKIYYKRDEMAEEFSGISTESRLLFRDALGLASDQQWKAYRDTISIKAANSDFARFKSPILYRPVIEGNKCHVYIHWDESGLDDLKAQRFTISHRAGNRPEVGHPRGGQIPSLTKMRVYETFSLEDYFKFISERYKKVRKGTVRMGSGERKNDYIEQIFSPKCENFSSTETLNTPRP